MYIISLIIFIIVFFIVMSLGAGIGPFLDAPSILIVLLIPSSMLVASGYLKDFIRSFKIVVAKENVFSLVELKKSLLAIKLIMKLLLASGGIGTITGFVMLLSRLSSPSEIGPYLAVALLTWFYSLLFWVVFLPIRSKIEGFIVDNE